MTNCDINSFTEGVLLDNSTIVGTWQLQIVNGGISMKMVVIQKMVGKKSVILGIYLIVKAIWFTIGKRMAKTGII